ncbi:hypothetical protein DSL64_20840 [Dyadobacter luteus]|jgi:hypothetical protein|uniref:Uncharacterized protein n=1 Tax=Dyadobacter luteus TaxID=2259619 RepID=A0A3D8Y6U9_9BACT|nr:hypothetical protein [Dyadobacter luteus]REA58535.1 hypothetical protein DSL64_20840 [Dyadobacter luteus]
MERSSFKKKWYNWRMFALVIILAGIFIKFYILEDQDENAPVAVQLELDKVAFGSEQEVEAFLGKGKLLSYFHDDNLNCQQCPKMAYKDGKVEIIFINQIADRITLNGLSDYNFDGRVILGLLDLKEDIKPTIDNQELKQWDNYQKYSQISAFGRRGKIEYILIKAKARRNADPVK